jgi:hypothetical protein
MFFSAISAHLHITTIVFSIDFFFYTAIDFFFYTAINFFFYTAIDGVIFHTRPFNGANFPILWPSVAVFCATSGIYSSTIVIVYPAGTTIIVYPAGTTIIVYPTGTAIISSPSNIDSLALGPLSK